MCQSGTAFLFVKTWTLPVILSVSCVCEGMIACRKCKIVFRADFLTCFRIDVLYNRLQRHLPQTSTNFHQYHIFMQMIYKELMPMTAWWNLQQVALRLIVFNKNSRCLLKQSNSTYPAEAHGTSSTNHRYYIENQQLLSTDQCVCLRDDNDILVSIVKPIDSWNIVDFSPLWCTLYQAIS